MASDVNKLVSENNLFCIRLSCHVRNRFHKLEGRTVIDIIFFDSIIGIFLSIHSDYNRLF